MNQTSIQGCIIISFTLRIEIFCLTNTSVFKSTLSFKYFLSKKKNPKENHWGWIRTPNLCITRRVLPLDHRASPVARSRCSGCRKQFKTRLYLLTFSRLDTNFCIGCFEKKCHTWNTNPGKLTGNCHSMGLGLSNVNQEGSVIFPEKWIKCEIIIQGVVVGIKFPRTFTGITWGFIHW